MSLLKIVNAVESLAAEQMEFMNDCISFLNPECVGSWEPISVDEIRLSQIKLLKDPKFKNAKRWILDKEEQVYKVDVKNLIPRLIIHNHVISGHSKSEEVERLKKYKFEQYAEDVQKEIEFLRQICLHCDRKPTLTRRPLYSIPHSSEPNTILHSDYLYIKDGYLLTLVDDLSRKVMLLKTDFANSWSVVKKLTRWKSQNGLPDEFTLMTDQGSHY